MQSKSQGVLSVQIAFLIFVVTVKRTQLGLSNVFSQSQDRLKTKEMEFVHQQLICHSL